MTKQFLPKSRWLVTIILLTTLCINQMWGDVFTMNSTSGTFNSNWDKTTRTALQTYASQASIQIMGANGGVEGEISSKSTFTGITAISINATASKAQTLTVYYKTTAANAEWTQLSTKSISKNTSSYSNYDITITGIPSSAVYIKFRSGGNSIYIRTITIRVKTTVTLDINGGSADGSVVFAYNATSKDGTLTAPTYSGYTVSGYYAEAGCTTKVLNADGSFAATNVSGWITSSKWTKDGATAKLYAKWTAAASCTATPSIGAASLNGSFIWT